MEGKERDVLLSGATAQLDPVHKIRVRTCRSGVSRPRLGLKTACPRSRGVGWS